MARFRSTKYRDGLPTGDSGHLAALKVEQEEAGGVCAESDWQGKKRD